MSMEILLRCIVTAMSDQMKRAADSPKISPMNAGRSPANMCRPPYLTASFLQHQPRKNENQSYGDQGVGQHDQADRVQPPEKFSAHADAHRTQPEPMR